MPDPFDLARFVDAQAPAYATALAELRAGHKRSHWIWFVFPQIEGLGFSAMSHRYAIRSRSEAEAYLAHPLLGPRLRACTEAVLAVPHKTLNAILGTPDDMKFRSSMTLFDAVEPDACFAKALEKFCGGARDQATFQRLGRCNRRNARSF